jgi:hypothetical protein
MALFHGAGTNCEAKLMVAVADAFCAAGFLVLRGDLPFRQQQRPGPPRDPKLDQSGIARAGEELRKLAPGVPVILAGHSYGGRMCTILASDDPAAAHALMLLSYPLKPASGKPRTEHFPRLRTPALFVHGVRDTFGTIDEMREAVALIPARTVLKPVEKAGHSLPPAIAASLPEWLSAIMN